MSGIGGIVHPDGRPVAAETLNAMSARLRHRGPGGYVIHRDGAAGVFSRSMAVNDWSRAFFRNETIVVAADCRIDNRKELLRRLELPEVTSDAALIGSAYMRWGSSCPRELIGDFSFAVWDAAKQRLFCARDLLGVKPFYFHGAPRRFVFGSEIKALFAVAEIPVCYDEERIADYLAGITTREDYTFFRDVRRLPPGHALTAGRDGLRIWRYGTIEPEQGLSYGSDDEWAEAFGSRFSEAVSCRVRNYADVALTLSGGLDSSSMAAVAAGGDTTLHTFSAIFDESPACDERTFINDMLARHACAGRFISGDLAPGTARAELEQVASFYDEPMAAPNLVLPARLFRAISKAGLNVVLDGHGGDEVVSQGTGCLKELAERGEWWRLATEIRHLARAYQEPLISPLLAYLSYGLRRRSAGRVLPSWGARAVGKIRGMAVGKGDETVISIVSDELARRTALEERRRDLRRPRSAATERERHMALVNRPERASAFEVLDQLAHGYSIEPCYPFWDLRLVRFCLAVPPEQKLRNGYGRFILRQAMRGLLPESVRLRRTKANFLPNLIRGLNSDESKLHHDVASAWDIINVYVDASALGEVCRRVEKGTSTISDVTSVLNVTLLRLWLSRHEQSARERTDVHPPEPSMQPARSLFINHQIEEDHGRPDTQRKPAEGRSATV